MLPNMLISFDSKVSLLPSRVRYFDLSCSFFLNDLTEVEGEDGFTFEGDEGGILEGEPSLDPEFKLAWMSVILSVAVLFKLFSRLCIFEVFLTIGSL